MSQPHSKEVPVPRRLTNSSSSSRSIEAENEVWSDSEEEVEIFVVSKERFRMKRHLFRNVLGTYVNIHEATEKAKNVKRELYRNLTLKTFLSGLKEPLGTNIRCIRPNNLSEALQLVLQEENVQYFKNLPNKINTCDQISQSRPCLERTFDNVPQKFYYEY
ncbi:hypothetical protein TcasGA2_TC001801 [Tribolium castaneum]|uniref:Uncharacterized protein n=1 Tax=Tribolium castaneum TaxID=7070 RepID=D7EKW3_TRICA|nr:hypothetical protein TcasGA2_TC001801 [Tribolium castaneum]